MTTTPLTASISLDDGGELIAAVPHLLGYHPENSLVVVNLVPEGGLQIGPVLRVDLPPPHLNQPMARRLAETALAYSATTALVLVVGGDGPLSHRALVEVLDTALDDVGVTVEHSLWVNKIVEGESWLCYSGPDCGGDVPDPHTAPLATTMADAGLPTYPSRKALADTLTADPPDVLARRKALITARLDSAPESTPTMATIHAALTATPPLDDATLVEIALALTDPNVRADCLKLALTPQAKDADALWTRLVTSLPAPQRAEPACALAVSAYLRGEGTLARIALDIALESAPRHTLAALLTAAIDYSIPPDELKEIINRSAT